MERVRGRGRGGLIQRIEVARMNGRAGSFIAQNMTVHHLIEVSSPHVDRGHRAPNCHDTNRPSHLTRVQNMSKTLAVRFLPVSRPRMIELTGQSSTIPPPVPDIEGWRCWRSWMRVPGARHAGVGCVPPQDCGHEGICLVLCRTTVTRNKPKG